MGTYLEAIGAIFGATESRKSRKAGQKPPSPGAPVATEEDAQGAQDEFFSGANKRRAIASTAQGGQTKRKTLGNA